MKSIVTTILFALLAFGGVAHAQRADVEGVELGIEGDVTVPRGESLRWIVSAYEVRGLSELQPAPDAHIHVATSFGDPGDAAEVTTDTFGRAMVTLPVPDDAPGTFRAILRVVTAGGRQRRFEVPVRVRDGLALAVHIDRRTLSPDGPLRAFGRLSRRASGRPVVDSDVELTLRDDQARPIGAPVTVHTDPAGLFVHTFSLPDDVRGGVSVRAHVDDHDHPVDASARAEVQEPTREPLIVSVAPEGDGIVVSEAQVMLDVAVRTGEGRPVAGAVVVLTGRDPQDPQHRALTDARGRARLRFRAPRVTSDFMDVPISVTASREGWGSATGQTSIRLAGSRYGAAFAVESGALVPSLGGRVYTRLVGADGLPAREGIEVIARGPRLPASGVRASTDRDGVATLDVTLPRAADASADRCGGTSATALDVSIDGASALEICLTLDPDAAARVRLARPEVASGGALEVTVDRVASAARLPVELTVMGCDAAAIASEVLGANEREARIVVPADVSGLVFVRARPLVGASREVVRGGTTAAWVRPSEPAVLSTTAAPSGLTQVSFGGGPSGASAVVFAAPIDLARESADALRALHRSPYTDLRREPGGATDALLAAALAVETPPDLGAPAVLRGRDVVSMPAPADPSSIGLLRDPWRSRARFVTGRLALIIVALERTIADALPERIDDVADTGGRTFTFNRQVLESVAASSDLGPTGATGLGGDPLTIEQLQRFDPTLTYQNVARRITRQRLFKLILALRTFTMGHGFDLPWSRLGDPSEWMRQLQGQFVPGIGSLEQRDLVDGWGRPFEIRRARGDHARFSFVDPLGAWEVVSSGADGRFGTGDDQWDPTARVLRSGTPYADAVGEDVLVARLEGVELGRASVELLTQVEPRAQVGYVPERDAGNHGQLARQLWSRLPTVFHRPPSVDVLRRPARPGFGAGGALHRLGGERSPVHLAFDEEPRTWGVVTYAWTDQGFGAVDLTTVDAGAPLIVEAPVPSRLHAGEPVELDMTITNVSDGPLSLAPRASGEGFEVTAPPTLELAAGTAERLTLRITPDAAPGRGAITLAFESSGERLREVRFPIHRVSGAHPLRVRSAGLVRARPWQVGFGVPADASHGVGRVVVLAPTAFSADPDMAEIRDDDPALLAFADALANRPSDPTLWSSLLRHQSPDGMVDGRDPWLSSACALVAWAGADPEDQDARTALMRVRGVIANGAVSDEPGRTAAVLAALSAGGVPALSSGSERADDPVVRVAAALRESLRTRLRVSPEEPSLLARAAAGLLLADPRDAYGLAMLERALGHVTAASDGGLMVVPSEERAGGVEALSATFALAIAAHQAGRDAEAERLVRGGLARDHVAIRAGGEPLFWLLAAASYGALGASAERVTVTVDGQRHDLSLESGRAVVPFSPAPGGHEVVASVEGGAAFIRVEGAVDRPFVDRNGGVLTLAMSGDVGDASTLAAVELTVHANERVRSPLVEIQLPAGAVADQRLRDAILSSGVVRAVEVRDPGFLRVWLTPMEPGTDAPVPLPVRWTVRGTLHGFGAVAYPLDRPEAMTSIAPQRFELGAAETP